MPYYYAKHVESRSTRARPKSTEPTFQAGGSRSVALCGGAGQSWSLKDKSSYSGPSRLQLSIERLSTPRPRSVTPLAEQQVDMWGRCSTPSTSSRCHSRSQRRSPDPEKIKRLATPRPPAEAPAVATTEASFQPEIGMPWGKNDCYIKEMHCLLTKHRYGQKPSHREPNPCHHFNAETGDLDHLTYCKDCRALLCDLCWNDESCIGAKAKFEALTKSMQAAKCQEAGLVDGWMAQVLQKTSKGVVERMTIDVYRRQGHFRQRRGAMRGANRAAAQVVYLNPGQLAWSGCLQTSPEEIAANKAYVSKLAQPKKAKDFPDIPYLPNMKTSLPAFEVVERNMLCHVLDEDAELVFSGKCGFCGIIWEQDEPEPEDQVNIQPPAPSLPLGPEFLRGVSECRRRSSDDSDMSPLNDMTEGLPLSSRMGSRLLSAASGRSLAIPKSAGGSRQGSRANSTLVSRAGSRLGSRAASRRESEAAPPSEVASSRPASAMLRNISGSVAASGRGSPDSLHSGDTDPEEEDGRTGSDVSPTSSSERRLAHLASMQTSAPPAAPAPAEPLELSSAQPSQHAVPMMVCKYCAMSLCPSCSAPGQVCFVRQAHWEGMSDEQKAAACAALGIPQWKAKAMLRCTPPAYQRLSPEPPTSRRQQELMRELDAARRAELQRQQQAANAGKWGMTLFTLSRMKAKSASPSMETRSTTAAGSRPDSRWSPNMPNESPQPGLARNVHLSVHEAPAPLEVPQKKRSMLKSQKSQDRSSERSPDTTGRARCMSASADSGCSSLDSLQDLLGEQVTAAAAIVQGRDDLKDAASRQEERRSQQHEGGAHDGPHETRAAARDVARDALHASPYGASRDAAQGAAYGEPRSGGEARREIRQESGELDAAAMSWNLLKSAVRRHSQESVNREASEDGSAGGSDLGGSRAISERAKSPALPEEKECNLQEKRGKGKRKRSGKPKSPASPSQHMFDPKEMDMLFSRAHRLGVVDSPEPASFVSEN
eukprot:TRINITY_DN28011_c0_g2_i4.p1 TRINITY_DN28011_c0_g2~~TRINITY_DN28011_c0_g2_i4.p1  ORF type:complete len:994 (+),score=218.25 TRINITY_DN28011_c0_g2_i4:208-3189(+)